MKTNKRLSLHEYVRLTDWIRTNAERLMALAPSMRVGAELAAKELGFALADCSFAQALDVSGVRWSSKSSPRKARTRRDLMTVAQELSDVMTALGMTPSKPFARLMIATIHPPASLEAQLIGEG